MSPSPKCPPLPKARFSNSSKSNSLNSVAMLFLTVVMNTEVGFVVDAKHNCSRTESFLSNSPRYLRSTLTLPAAVSDF